MLIEKETKEKVKNDYNEGKIKCRIKTYLTGKVKMLNFRGGGQSTWSSHWIRVCISIYRTAVTYMLKYIYHFSFNLIYMLKTRSKSIIPYIKNLVRQLIMLGMFKMKHILSWRI